MRRLLIAAALWAAPLVAQVTPPSFPSHSYADGFFTSIVGQWQGTACAATGPVLLDVPVVGQGVVFTRDVPFCASMLFTYGQSSHFGSGWGGWADVSYTVNPLLQRLATEVADNQGVTFQVPLSVCGGPPCTFDERSGVQGRPPLETWSVLYDFADPAPDLARPVSAVMGYEYNPGNTPAYLDLEPTGAFPVDRTLTFTLTPVPEPSSLALLGIGLVGIAAAVRRRGRGAERFKAVPSV